jgi:hypothetical protein
VLRAAAKLHPTRTYYYRMRVDIDRLVEQATKKVRQRAKQAWPTDSVFSLVLKAVIVLSVS